MRFQTTFWLILLAAGLAALIWYQERFYPGAGGTSQLLPGLDAEDVRSVEVIQDNEVIRAERTNRAWRLTQPLNYPASDGGIDNLLTELTLTSRRPLLSERRSTAEKPDATDFGLEPPRIRLNLRTSAKRIGLLIGKETLTKKHIYLQLVGSEGIFLADTSLVAKIPASAAAWRDRDFMNLDDLDFDRIRVQQSGERAFVVQHDPTNQLWRMIEPLKDNADNRRITALLQGLETLRIREFVSDDPDANLEPYGLSSPGLKVILAKQTNVVSEIAFGGSPTNRTGLVYALCPNRKNVVSVPKTLFKRFQRSHTAFRDRRLLRIDAKQVDRIEVEGKRDFTLERQGDSSWQITEPETIPADTALVEDFLTSLNELKIREFVKDVVTDFSQYHLESPSRRYTLKQSKTVDGSVTNRVLAQVDFGTNKVDLVYARRAQDNAVYGVSLAESLDLPQEPYEIRDRQIWDLNSTNLTEVVIHQKGRSRKLIRGDDQEWGVPPGDPGDINSFAVKEALYRLSRLRAKAWVGKGSDIKEQLGFSEVNYRIDLKVARPNRETPAVKTVSFGRKAPTGRPYACVVLGGEPIVFEFPKSVYQLTKRNLTAPPP